MMRTILFGILLSFVSLVAPRAEFLRDTTTVSQMAHSCHEYLLGRGDIWATHCAIRFGYTGESIDPKIVGNQRICLPSEIDGKARAYAYVHYYRQHRDEIAGDLNSPWLVIAPDAYLAAFPC